MPAANHFKAQAKAKGLDRYFTGKPCIHGHVAERYVNGGDCVECASGRSAAQPKSKRHKSALNKQRAAVAEL